MAVVAADAASLHTEKHDKTKHQKLGNRYDEPQPVAAFRLGTMMHHGFIPYVGVNMTEARRLYEKVRTRRDYMLMYSYRPPK